MNRPAHTLRILMSTDAVGGVWTYSLDLARSLAKRGVRTILAVLGPAPSDLQVEAALSVPELTLNVTHLPLDWMAETPEEITRTSQDLGEMAERERVDIVQLHTPVLACRAPFSVPVVSIHHSCLATWWNVVKMNQALPSGFRWHTQLVAQGIMSSDIVAAPTAAFAHLVRDTYAIGHVPIVVHNGRAMPSVAPQMDAQTSPFVFASGRLWDEGKNFRNLDRASALMDAPVVAAGPRTGPNGEWVDLRHVRMLGTLDERRMRHNLSRAPVYASLSRYEPFGLGVLEAAQAGCALVLSDIATFRELWSDAALFVAESDECAVAEALELLLQDEEWRQELASRAFERSRRYSLSVTADRMLGIYEHLTHAGNLACEAVL